MYHGIKVNNGIATLYKSVRKNLSSFRDSKFKYAVGEFLHHEVDEDVTAECSIGLHVSHLDWAIRFGKYECDKDGFVILECEVPVDKIILPESSDGKVRTSDLFVVREVPENEWKNLK
jgi:hypothetical protein